jgi:glycosyltransferase involved in cell wall biosynthesis
VPKTIILITSGQPSLNPRLVKEADALVEAGYNVRVIYQYWNSWATNLDEKLLPQKKWKAIRIGGDPLKEKAVYWRTRITLKIARKLVKSLGFSGNLAELAIGRCTFQLAKKAKNTSGDLYIAHNLAALPAAVLAAKHNNAKCGFDAEDLHRYEMSDDDLNDDVRLKKYLEEKYFPLVNYLTTSSPEIAKKYEVFFSSLKFNTLLNVFPKNERELITKKDEESLKLFWFSQNVGLSRGLQDILGALKIIENEKVEFHILGFLSQQVKTELDQIIQNLNFIHSPKIIFHPPIESTELTKFASKFDIGLATEPGFSINNDIALSNKIFTYAQAGLAIIASDTTAQKQFMAAYPNMGAIYEKKNSIGLASILKDYIEHKDLLAQHQAQSSLYAKEKLNWEVEKEKFLSIIHSTINA